MLKSITNIAVYGAFLLVFGFLAYLLWQSLFGTKEIEDQTNKPETAQSEQQRANEQAGGARPRGLNPTEEVIAEYTKWLAVFTALLVLATIALFVSGERNVEVANRGAKAAQQSANVARDTLIAVNRPWISIEVSIDSDLTWSGDEARITLRFDLKNIGKFPADVNVPITSAIHLMFGPTDPVEAHQELCQTRKFPYKGLFGFSLFPNDTAVERNIDLIRPEEVSFFKQREGGKQFTPAVIGCVKYAFALDDREHATPFFFHLARIDPQQPGKLLAIEPNGMTISKAYLRLEKAISPGPAT